MFPRNNNNNNAHGFGGAKNLNKNAKGSATARGPVVPTFVRFKWFTKLSATEQTQLLTDTQNLDTTRETLESKFTNYRNLARLPSRATLEKGTYCKECNVSKVAINSESLGCFLHPAGQRRDSDTTYCERCETSVEETPGCLRRFEHGKFVEPPTPTRSFTVAAATAAKKTRALIVIDAEFVVLHYKDKSTWQTIGSFAAVDGITGEVLLNKVVAPAFDANLHHITYVKSGQSEKKFRDCKRDGTALVGLNELQKRVQSFTDNETIFCGHAVYNDLQRLGAGVDKIVDTQVMFDGDGGSKLPGLKWLVERHLPALKGFQVTEDHDALEDACATRELLLIAINRN